jgi:membrane-bound lytic murein transglycosylase B
MKRQLCIVSALLSVLFVTVVYAYCPSGIQREWLVDALAREFPRDTLQTIFEDPRFQINAGINSSRPAGWDYLTQGVSHPVKRGKQFMQEYRWALKRTEKWFGIPKTIQTSVLHIETNFGISLEQVGVLSALSTSYLSSSPRTEEGKKKRRTSLRELACFLRLSQQERWDPLDAKGSPQGAFGLPQFMPCTYLAYAQDGNGDGVANPFNMEDALASVGNFLQAHGWESDPVGALFHYNRSTRYGEEVLAYAKKIGG